ncbi:hypothetical protein LCGC14_0956190 [marine sediment metagenome]|uniref:Uncharacterized protein n=1 Tax=marine sediment metagenome TaxID=412755 RepID=A0A0F9RM95_9ZZZZ
MGGQEALRGYLLQTISCVLDAFNEDNNWSAVALEPNIESEKVDIIWHYSNPTKIVVDQVKSSKNLINIHKVKTWSKDLKEYREADVYNLILIGSFSDEVTKTDKVENVVLKLHTLNIEDLMAATAHKLGLYIESNDYKPLTSSVKEIIVKSLVTQFELYSTNGKEISRNDFDTKLFKWISDISPKSIKKKIFDILISKDFITYENWGEFKNISTPRQYVKEEQRLFIIKEVREKLKNPDDETPIIRITGLPGVGKRRLVFEILSPPELNNNSYFIYSKAFKDSNLISKILSNKDLELTLILNDCNLADHNEYREIFGNQGSRISIITISEEVETTTNKSFQYLLKNLSAEYLQEILRIAFGGLPEYLVQRFSEFSEGFPRFALDLAKRYGENPSDYSNIIELTDKNLLDKFIAGKLLINSSKFEKTKRVLMGIALFKKVGYKDQLLKQAKWVCSEISKLEWEEFQLIVREQRDRGLIEGYYYLHINPFLLETYLYSEWWETYGNFETIQEFQDFIEKFPVNLDVYFYDSFFYDVFISRFKYINHTTPGKYLIQKMLSSGSILFDKEILNSKSFINLICNLIESNIDLGINYLKNVLNSWSNKDLNQFIEGRNEILWLLEKLAFRDKYFDDAALLLLKLAETHPTRPTYESLIQPLNNAIEFFVKIFSPMWGEASPEKKYELLIRIFNKNSMSRKSLILQGFCRTLTTYFSWDGWVESLGNLPPPNIWEGNWEDICIHYIRSWIFLFELGKNKEEKLRLEILDILITSSRGLLNQYFPELNDVIRKSFKDFLNYDWIDKLELLAKVSSIIQYEGRNFPDEVLTKWIQLKESLRSKKFKDELRIFLGWNDLELIELNQKYESKVQIDIKLKKLAKKIKDNPLLLQENLFFLNTNKIFRGLEFGKVLGELDEDLSLKEYLIKFLEEFLLDLEDLLSLNNISIDFLAGYLRILCQKNAKECEELISALSRKELFQYFIPEIVRLVCLNDNMIKLVMQLINNKEITIESLNGYRFFGYSRDISEEIFKKWIKFLMEKLPNNGIDFVCTSFFYYYGIRVGDKKLPKKITLKILKQPIHQKISQKFSNFEKRIDQNHYISFYKEIAKKLVEQHPETAENLFEMIIEFNMNPSSYKSPFTEVFNEILTFITQNYSNEVWKKIEKILEFSKEPKLSFILHWLSKEAKGSSNLELFDNHNIINWIKEDIENRAKILAEIIPIKRFNAQNSISRDFLELFGDLEDVRKAFTHNFTNGRIYVYLPEKTNPYQGEKDRLLKIYENETSDNIKRWIKEYIGNHLDRDIERANKQKERSGRYGF